MEDNEEKLRKRIAELEIELAKWVQFWRDKDNASSQARITELEHQLKVECDTYLWKRKIMSRRIALLGGWMEKLFKYADANRNQLTMTTEIPDTLMQEGIDYLNRETLGNGNE